MELSLSGFAVVRRPRPEGELPHLAVQSEAQREDAAAAVLLNPVLGGVEIWLRDRVTGKTVMREALPPATGRDAEAVVALRTVELLRASFIEVQLPQYQPTTVKPTMALRALLPPPPGATSSVADRLTVQIGAVWVWSPGGVGGVPGVDLQAGYWPWRRVEIAGWAMVPWAGSGVFGMQGEASILPVQAGARADFRLLDSGAKVDLLAGPGFGVAWLHMRGTAAHSGYQATSDDVVTASASGKVSVRYRIREGLRLYAAGSAGVAFPVPTVEFAGVKQASWGRPWIAAAGGFDIALW